MSSQHEDLTADLADQLEKVIAGGFQAGVKLDAGNEKARELERRLNTLIDAARAGAAPAKKLGWFLDSIVENAPIMLFVKNAEDLKVELWNRRAEELSGVSREAILGKTGFETFPVEEMEEFHRRDRAVLAGKELIAAEEALTSPSGETRWVYTKKIPLLDEDGTPRYLLAISEDITERKHATQALLEAKEAAEGVSRVKSELIANVSHELRTPLTLIAGTLDSLLLGEAGAIDGPVRERLGRMRRNAARLTSLVNDLLDFSRLEAGKAVVRREPVRVAELVADIVEEAQATAQSRGLALEMQASVDMEYVPLDRSMIEKIVLNLVGNALKFTPAGGRIDVSVGVAGGELALSVRDTGVGVPADKLPLLFERFHQVDSSASRRYEGTGIGLALVKELAGLMGGRVSASSEVGKGSLFSVHIPCGADQRELSPDTTARERPSRPFEHLHASPVLDFTGDLTGKPRLVLAEDNADMRAYVTELLSSEYDVVAVGDGREAIASARSYLPDVIVTDVMMPEMNGFELVAHLKRDPELRQVPVLLLTARAGTEAIASGLESGADDYLSKPFSPAELRARIAAARRLHKAYQDLALRMEELLATRDQLVAAEKLSLAGRLARSVAEQLSGPLALVQQRLAARGAGPGAPEALAEARDAIDRVAGLIKGLGRLAEPPSLRAPERVDVARFIESILGELPESMSGRVSLREWAGQVGFTDIAPGDLRVAIASVLSFLCQTPEEPIAVELRKERDRPCVTLSSAALRLSPEEREQILDPRVEADGEAGGSLRLDIGLAIASQILRRNGAELSVHPILPEGVAFQVSFEGVS